MRRAVARRYRFAEVDYGEDIDWALRIARDRALRREHYIDADLYHYRSRRAAIHQGLIERTEPLRHALGLRYSNWIRAWRALSGRRRR